MSAQTSYSIDQPKGYPGVIYAQSPSDLISRSVETVAGVPFGYAVSRGTNADEQCLLGGAAALFLGITVRSLEREGAVNTGDVQYNQFEAAGIMRTGDIWVTVPAGCVPGDQVKYNATTGVIDSGAAAAGEVQLDGAKFESTAGAGELAILHIETSLATDGS